MEWVDGGSVEDEVGKKLETVEQNPVPKRGMRGKAVENMRARRERRYRRRIEHMVGKREGWGLARGGGAR